ncbi:MAG: hypothetical protein P4L16_06505 [Chlamydiales bacterium]|nr:hypothetical protein [Chlamydiales bacterium]
MTNEPSPLDHLNSTASTEATKPITPGAPGEGPSTTLGSPTQEGGPAPFSIKQQERSAAQNPSPMDLSAQAAGSTTSLKQPTIPSFLKTLETSSTLLNKNNDNVTTTLTNLKKELETKHVPANLINNAVNTAYFKNPSTAPGLFAYLSKLNDNASFIGNKLNTPLTPSSLPSKPTNVVSHYLDYIAGSHTRLAQLTEALGHTKNLSPGDLMAVQVKMNGIQQQVEFFTTLLGKALSDISTIMGIQN